MHVEEGRFDFDHIDPYQEVPSDAYDSMFESVAADTEPEVPDAAVEKYLQRHGLPTASDMRGQVFTLAGRPRFAREKAAGQGRKGTIKPMIRLKSKSTPAMGTPAQLSTAAALHALISTPVREDGYNTS